MQHSLGGPWGGVIPWGQHWNLPLRPLSEYSQALLSCMNTFAGQRLSTAPRTVTTKSYATLGSNSERVLCSPTESQLLLSALGDSHQSTSVPLKRTYLTRS